MKAEKQTLSQIIRILQESEGQLSIKNLLPKVQQAIQERGWDLSVNYRKVYRAVREENKKKSSVAIPYEL